MAAKHLPVVRGSCLEGTDEALNDWYTNIHLRDICKLEGFLSAQRFKIADRQVPPGDGPYKAKAGDTVEMYIDPSLDPDRTVVRFYTPITERVLAESASASEC
jgi:hypothetical protein